MNMHSLGGSHLIKHECLDRYHVIVAMQAEKEVLLNAQGSTSISVVQFPEFCLDYFSCPKQKQGPVRRMNKLLGPGLSLDAKNPKDTNAAMDASGSLTSRVPTSVSFPSLEDNMNVDEVNMVRTESGPLSKHSTGDSNEPRLATNAVSVGEWVPSGSSSIWDDEDTRDAFSFQKNRLAGSSKLANVAYPGVNGEPYQLVEATSGDEGPCNLPDELVDPMEEGPTTINTPGKTLCGVCRCTLGFDPDSLGPMDLDIRSSKHTEDLNLNKSLDVLRRLIATSLDAFQNCSLFGFDSKKDTSNMV
ncbi:hypothetical protein Bca4012_034081 [Brassica carinata]|uniref:Uncharacterized protein n=1 Tax=Brassica carinata TaxID=52824 RepID=A0A8X7RBS6_BRACI|nr:hypothetical protein Bca52824_045035 [Brassica carinata]